jgi:hypothetical protein
LDRQRTRQIRGLFSPEILLQDVWMNPARMAPWSAVVAMAVVAVAAANANLGPDAERRIDLQREAKIFVSHATPGRNFESRTQSIAIRRRSGWERRIR